MNSCHCNTQALTSAPLELAAAEKVSFFESTLVHVVLPDPFALESELAVGPRSRQHQAILTFDLLIPFRDQTWRSNALFMRRVLTYA